MNATMKKFGAPETIVRDYRHWAVLLRPAQVTLGSLVLVSKQQATRFSMLDRDAFAEMQFAIADIEQVLSATFDYDKINYLMLMMVDPDVHFHVIPRYQATKEFAGAVFNDSGWPGPPELSQPNTVTADVSRQLLETLRGSWPLPT